MISVVPFAGGAPLQSLTPEQAGPLWGVDASEAGLWAGWPVHGPRYWPEGSGYLVEGLRITYLPIPPTGTAFRLTYWSKQGQIPGETSGNKLIDFAAQIWLYAAARHGALAMADDEALRRFDAAFESGVNAANQNTDQWSAGSGFAISMR
jgi:hypothetical protein